VSGTVRLTRAEKKAETRARLLESATAVFAEKGMARGSIDDVAEHAGFTKGAFYANFASKEELFLALLDEHFADVLERVDRAITVSPSAGARAVLKARKPVPAAEPATA